MIYHFKNSKAHGHDVLECNLLERGILTLDRFIYLFTIGFPARPTSDYNGHKSGASIVDSSSGDMEYAG